MVAKFAFHRLPRNTGGREIVALANDHIVLDRPIPPPRDDAASNSDFILEVRICDFEKRGDGMNAYIVYKLVTKCEGVPGISDRTYEVWRRFSDFLGLHDKLFEKYISKGIIVPAAPEKSIAAMTKTKATSDPATSRDVAVRRARQLERFLKRVVQHPRLRIDCDVRDFLTIETELPRASQTAALSGAGMKRMIKSVGEVFSKMAFHMEEGDRWFEQTQSHVEELDESLRKLLHLSESLTSTRKELAGAQESMSKGLSMLASCEESTALARALSHLTETEENTATLWAKQSEMDSIRFTESLSEYVGLVGSLKELFAERVRVWQNWQSAQQSLARKREQKARLELSGKNDRAAALRDEMDEAVRRMDQLEAEFGDLSKLIREEIGRFEVQRRNDMRQMFVEYLESLVQTHTEVIIFIRFGELQLKY
ncbi:PX domain protein [Necator americanus]|uniref:PX domain protein n=1 Tax=Necator americanus TaxID=51031 RepID=W2TWV3_NECAM|nr:PX domain protein [Necator americanus]ETN85551.1 PX domain protein [Necator americanus]